MNDPYSEEKITGQIDYYLRISSMASSDYKRSNDKRYLKLKEDALKRARYWQDILDKQEAKNE